MTEETLWGQIEHINLFAEVDPNQKERIILALKKKAHVVGYMGDGINDLPALHAADVSISVDNAVDVAKESADIVLMEKSLSVLNRGIEEGRTTFSNTLKYIWVTTSANFGNMFSVAGISMILNFFPLLPKQILLLNFLTDFPALSLSGDSVDEEMVQTPRKWDIKFIQNFMFTFGLLSSVFDYLITFILFSIFRESQGLYQSGWFTFSILTELATLMVIRTQKPFFKSKPAPLLIGSTLIIGVVTMLLPYTPLASLFALEPIPLKVIVILLLLISIYIAAMEGTKYFFYRYHRNC
jgi:Mg2+-importing ATPase